MESVESLSIEKLTLHTSLLVHDSSDEIALEVADKLSPLCRLCSNYISGLKTREHTSPFEQSIADLRRHAEDGSCHLCALRWGQLLDYEKRSLEGCMQIQTTYIDYAALHSYPLSVNYAYFFPGKRPRAPLNLGSQGFPDGLVVRSTSDGPLMNEEQGVVPPVISFTRAADVDQRYTHFETPMESNDSALCFGLVQYWTKKCTTEHVSCNALHDEPPTLPTRLLDLGAGNKGGVRLCNGASIPPTSKYATLSHCWGKGIPTSLSQENLIEFYEEIAQELPKTFRDAIKVTRELGLRYLWIDSLCIIQDSVEDWRREASLMDGVYHNSWISIAATKAEDCHSGLFTERKFNMVQRCRVRINSTLSYMYVDSWKDQVDQSPLLRRAWVTQERVLTPRILHYARDQLFWECHELKATELFPGGLPSRYVSPKPSLAPLSFVHERTLSEPGVDHWYEVWRDFVREYSCRKLTFPEKDKLVAIGGLAKRLGKADDYIAGLWRQILPHQLVWYVQRLTIKNPRPSTFQAPSWSWASVDNEINLSNSIRDYVESPGTTLITSIRASVSLVDQHNPFGQIRAGLLQLSGPLFYGTYFGDTFGCYKMLYTNGQWINMDDDTDDIRSGSSVLLLPIQKNPKWGETHHGIVLQPTGSKIGEYFRLGYFFRPPEGSDNKDSFDHLLSTKRVPENLAKYIGKDEKTGYNLYDISII